MLKVDRTHISEIIKWHHKPSPSLKSLRHKEKGQTKEHIKPRIGDEHQKNE